MPAISLFNRRTTMGGDDRQPFAILGMTLGTAQLLLLLVPIWIHIVLSAKHHGGLIEYIWYDPSNAATCRHAHFFPSILVCYATFSTVLILVALVVEQRIYHWSSVGSPTERQPRSSHVEQLLEFKLVPLTIAELLVVVTGATALAFAGRYHRCLTHSDTYVDDGIVVDDDYNDNNAYRDYLWGATMWWVVYGILLLSQSVQVLSRALYVGRMWRKPTASDMTGPQSIMRSRQVDPSHYHDHHELAEEMWETRCNSFCQFLSSISCFLFGGREIAFGDYGDIARALADYFETGGVLDVVPSDIVMGFLLLHRIQRRRVLEARQKVQEERNEMRFKDDSNRDSNHSESSVPRPEPLLLPIDSLQSNVGVEVGDIEIDHSYTSTELEFRRKLDGFRTYYETQSRKVLSRRHPFDLEVLREGAHFSRFALAIYTWMMYAYMYPIKGIPKLLWHSSSRGEASQTERDHSASLNQSASSEEGCHCLMEDDHNGIFGDNCCDLHRSALLLQLGLDKADLVYAQFRSSFSDIPYCIMLDHRWQSVVLAIRGTFSLEDCVTDVLIDPELLDSMGAEFGFEGQGEYCHGGVYACARALHSDLERHGILERLMLGDDAKYRHYTLRVVGHSLGAATGTLISMMIRQKFPTVRCLNYSPPGGSFSWDFSKRCQDFCTSFVLDCDLVPRLSLNSMDCLKNEVLEIIGRVKVPKVEATRRAVFLSGLFSSKLCQDGDLEEDGECLEQTLADVMYHLDEVPPDSEYQMQLDQYKDIQQERRSRRGHMRAVSLYPPGTIVHLVKTGERRSCLNTIAKCLTLCTTNAGSEYTPVYAGNDDFNEIVVSPTMGTDHFPNRVCLELEGVANDFGLDTSMPGATSHFDR